MTKTAVFSGFLGAGKTTLIKKLIKEVYEGQKIVLIENEFGEIGIDGGFLKDAGIEITEMNQGCICCSLVGDFDKALKEVVETYHPDRIIIEPSGVGKLSDVIKAIKNVSKDAGLELDCAVAVVDAKKAKMYMKNFGEFFSNQIENATTIVLSRTQMVTEEKLSQAVELVKGLNDKAAIITTPWEEIEGSVIVKAMEGKNDLLESLVEEYEHEHEHEHHHDHDHDHHHHEHDENCTCGCHDHDHEHHHHDHDHDHDHHHDHDHDHEHHHDHEGHHHADDVFTSWGMETPAKFTEDKIKSILEKLSGESGEYGVILRAKGIVPAEEGEWIHFDMVPGEYEIRRGAADYTGRLCVIGTELKEDKIRDLFA
ncbi:MAG: GTP-binding protein [Lachnospiraceae bacterium]|nr:GTP-binding protein [Lachnospiraceae bacterium]